MGVSEMDATDARREEEAKRILGAAKSVCDNDRQGVEVIRVSLLPSQTLMASVLHKFISGRLIEPPPRLSSRSTGRAKKG